MTRVRATFDVEYDFTGGVASPFAGPSALGRLRTGGLGVTSVSSSRSWPPKPSTRICVPLCPATALSITVVALIAISAVEGQSTTPERSEHLQMPRAGRACETQQS